MRNSPLLEGPLSEYETRIRRLTVQMKLAGLDGILLSAPDNMRYFCGHRSIVWDSNVSMPGTLIVSADGRMRLAGSQSNNPTARMTACVEEDCYIAYFNGGTRKPGQPGSYREAILQAFRELGLENAKIGMEWGRGCRVRMIHADYEAIIAGMPNAVFTDASDTIWAIRGTKSPYELELLRKANAINAKLFEHAYARIIPGVTTERELYNSMAAEAYSLGCDGILEMDVRGHKSRYGLPNCPPSDQPIGSEAGTSIMIDGGPSYKGYISDIIRVGVVGKSTPEQERLYKIALEGHAVGMSMLRPGVLISDVVAAVDSFYEKAGVSYCNHTKGWIGHSIGLNVHEYPCLEEAEHTPLKAGMVMSMEPALDTPTAGTMCLEQNFAITEDGYELLSKTPTELFVVH